MDTSANKQSDLILSDYAPRSQLVVAKTLVSKPKFNVIDAHNHLGEEFGGGWCNRPIEELIDVLDESHVDMLVDLDGGWGEDILHQRLDKYKAASPERFIIFGGVDWSKWPEYGDRFGEWAARRFRAQVRRGTQGLKVWKQFGLSVQDQHGKLVPVDDVRLAPLWEMVGELRVPVVIHVADPVAFFDPLDESNERWEELHAHPDWRFSSPPYPAFMDIMEQLANLVQSHPRTTFIGAHVGCYAENLGWVADLLDRAPNFYVDISARLGELGRQPYTARRFFIQYADRILFGTDFPANVERYRLFYRFLESDDEYFNYGLGDIPTQGRWRIYGLNLPDDVLENVYQLNARRVFSLD
jgi:predicted TIM-barrel fold metal-dependent hydrolase